MTDEPRPIRPPRPGSQLFATVSKKKGGDVVYIEQKWIDTDECECSTWVEMSGEMFQRMSAYVLSELLNSK
jgi:hypothetical protein